MWQHLHILGNDTLKICKTLNAYFFRFTLNRRRYYLSTFIVRFGIIQRKIRMKVFKLPKYTLSLNICLNP